MKIKQGINELPTYTANDFPANIVLDANESAYNIPAEIRQEIISQLSSFTFNRYPQIDARDLRTAIGKLYNLTCDNVQISNGSSELIGCLCQVFGGSENTIMYPVPSFSMYEIYVKLAQAKLQPYKLQADFSIDVEQLIADAKKSDPSLLIICNPNNPTGNLTGFSDIKKLLDNITCPILLDEAYIEFADYSATELLSSYPHLIVLRTFSKAYAMAGVRLGYMLSSQEIISIVSRVILPYQVNAISLSIGLAAVGKLDLYTPYIQKTVKAREAISAELTAYGFTVVPSATNFVFFYHSAGREYMQQLAAYIKGNMIAVRDFSKSDILYNGIRLTVGNTAENQRVLSCIRAFCISKEK